MATPPRPLAGSAPDQVLASLSAWIDAHPANAARDPEAATWGRVAKVAEEAGEAVAALIGVTGQNPRKAPTGTAADVERELLDVAVTALAAVEHLRGNDATALAALTDHLGALAERAGLRAGPDAGQVAGPDAGQVAGGGPAATVPAAPQQQARRHAPLDVGVPSAGAGYVEHERTVDLSVGTYAIAPGAVDEQTPHTEDEVYVVVSGSAVLRTPGALLPARRGDVLVVPAFLEHRFVDVQDDFRVVVVFGPAEGSRAGRLSR